MEIMTNQNACRGKLIIILVALVILAGVRPSIAEDDDQAGGRLTAPDLIRHVRPRYPALAKQAGIQGRVILEATINKLGSVENCRVVKGHPLLIQSALEAVEQWRYKPTVLGGVPVEVITRITVNFNSGLSSDERVSIAENQDDETVQYIRYLAGQGDVEAQNVLGGMYYFGQGVLQNYREATKWTRMAADQGHATAQERLGLMYREGQGVRENYYEAGKWLRRAVEGYRKAAEQGHAEAQYNLGRMYRDGEGVPQNDLEAAKWLRKAAEQGDPAAQYSVGLLRLQECVGAKIEWLRNQMQALRQNRVLSDWRIGQCDLVEAYAWVLCAAAQGHQVGRSVKELFRKKMTTEQVAEGQQLASELHDRIKSSKTE